MGFTSCRICKKTFVYGPNIGTNPMKYHSCVTYEAKTSTSLSMPTRSPKVQSTIDKMVMIGKTLTAEQSNLIKDLIVRWVCGRDLRRTPIPDYDSDSVGVGVGASNKESFGVRVGIGFSEKNFSESEL
jgi:hypothetical protein